MTTPWNRSRAALMAALILSGAREAAVAQPVTGVRGQVTDAETGDPLIEATVRVVKGGEGVTRTDLDGMYELPLEPGAYELRFSYDIYQSRRFRGVVVRRTGSTRLDVKLKPDPGAIEEVVVEARADIRTEAAGLQERKRSATVQDAVSAQEISRSPDSSAGDAVKRVVSATVVGGRYVFVRGLGGRYSMTLLNGVVLPSPDPDATAVPLDIFPASLLANLTVVKTYTPDLPGQFAGGTLMIETNTYPEDFELKFKLSSSLDSESAFRHRYTYVGGTYDYLGFDSGRRALPDSVPTDGPLELRDGIDPARIEAVGEDFENIWNLDKKTSMPNFGIGAQVGDTIRIGGRRLGYMATMSYGHKEIVQETEVAAVRNEQDVIVVKQSLRGKVGTESVTWGGLAAAGWEPSPKHSLRAVLLYTHSAEDRAQQVEGFSDSDSGQIITRRLQFVTRTLGFGQLTGDHHFSRFRVDWQGNLSFVNRYEPDTRDLSYDLDYKLFPQGTRFQNEPGSGERFFSELDDLQGGAGASVAVPFSSLELRAGVLAQLTNRKFSARRFRFSKIGGSSEPLFLPPEEMLSPEYIGPVFRLQENTLQSDAYDADQTLTAGYLMADVSRFTPLRVIGGVRYEVLAQTLTPGTPFAIADQPVPGVDRTNANFLPAVNVVYGVTPNMNVRTGYSYTIARPALRELAPFLFFDFVRRRAVSGNPALEDTRIHNVDARWEMFPSERAVLAASVFYKLFRDPIEQIIVQAGQGVSFTNAFSSRALGLELEARSTFGWLHKSLHNLRLAANLTLIDSKVDLHGEQPLQTNQNRPLQGQSPYVVNLDAGWSTKRGEFSVLYNVYGRRIAEVGIQTLPDVYEQPFHRLDASAAMSMGAGYKLKLGVTNILNQPVVLEQGDIVVQKYRPGVAAIVSLEWTP